jgi:5-methylcytosine-specific restriction enzyme subunit McrC
MTPGTDLLHLAVPEAGPGTVRELTGDQIAALLTVPGLVRLSPAVGGRWRVSGNQKAGLVRLRTPSGGAVQLLLRPKLPVGNLLFLLCHSPSDPWLREAVTGAESEDLLPAVAELLVRIARRTLEAGVLHGYRTVEEEAPLVRGQIRTAGQLRRFGMPLPVSIRYDDHTPDIAENRILLAALHLAARLPGLPRHTDVALRHLAHHLDAVQPPRPGEPLPGWTPNRLNSRYVPALRLAELLLSGRSVRLEGGEPVTADGFVLDMPTVFERFLTSALGDALARHGVRCAAQEQHHRLDLAGHVRLRPDLVLYRSGRTLSVVDAKYAVRHEPAPPTEHLYQLLSYCTALGLPSGHLVYATTSHEATVSRAPATDHVIRRAGITVTAHGLNLGGPPNTLLTEVSALADRIALSGPQGPPRRRENDVPPGSTHQ